LVQLFFLYFALPKIGISIAPAVCGTLGLGLLGGAYMAETVRSGLENIAPVQTESAVSLGMNRLQVFFYVVLPQAVRSSVPGVVANVIFLLKETSVFSTISLMDLMFSAKDLIGMYAKTIECLTMLVVFYLIMLLPVSILGSILERRLRYAEFGD
jgi:polar amino acid transport system permease protein